ncbi:MAG: nucleoside triphosphate pyrophosphohydrolase [Thermodesulfobacteriota bacterium]|nr:nucleoside triphosphate pyrophosphohydrolase [Thermodesulfobacteriota bacterium]
MERDIDSCHRGFQDLVSLVERLRGPQGCPWDRVQTPETIKVYLIEEAYELLEALDLGDAQGVCGELGDLLFHIVFLARVFQEKGDFEIGDVIRAIVDKMIRRHPHVFGKAQASTPKQVRDVWHTMKKREAEDRERLATSLLDSVPRGLPALMRAYRLGERASRLGIGEQDAPSAVERVEEDLADLKAVVQRDDGQGTAEAYGDLLRSVVSLGQFTEVHPETALNGAVLKFVNRLKAIEEALSREGRCLDSLSAEEMAAIWERDNKEKRM